MKKYFKCTLKTDIVLNATTATTGNIRTLDYIPGSNFLGLVAENYDKFEKEGKAYDIFHSGKVSFGDAHISDGDNLSYAMPFSLFQDKNKKGIINEKVWVHHHLNENNRPINIQLKQHRGGYFNKKNTYFKELEKKFSLKSSYDSKKRRSKDSAMFGYESIRKGQSFIFYVDFDDDKYIKDITEALLGKKRLGKSKTAQYGQVEIELLKETPSIYQNGLKKDGEILVYAESNLCLLNEYGQATFQPNPKLHFGIKGKVLWEKSQIRTYSYSPWNNHRQTRGTQRDCILKGSVIVIKTDDNYDVSKLQTKVGGYFEEGFGRIIYNPDFLDANKDGLWTIELSEVIEEENKEKDKERLSNDSKLGNFLKKKKEANDNEMNTSTKINVFIDSYGDKFDEVSSSQWGEIRNISLMSSDVEDLINKLFRDPDGFLSHGVAAKKYWNVGIKKETLKKRIEKNAEFGLNFTAKLASEMAKRKQKLDKKN